MEALNRSMRRTFGRWEAEMGRRVLALKIRAKSVLGEESAQGTTEYAILVGVLVVIAIVAIVAFRDKVQELWTSISDGINSL